MKTTTAVLATLLICFGELNGRSAAQMADPALQHVTVTVPPSEQKEDEPAGAAAAEAIKALKIQAIEGYIESAVEEAVEGVIFKEIRHIGAISPEALEAVVEGAVMKQIANIKEMNVYEGTVNIYDYTQPDSEESSEADSNADSDADSNAESEVDSEAQGESVESIPDPIENLQSQSSSSSDMDTDVIPEKLVVESEDSAANETDGSTVDAKLNVSPTQPPSTLQEFQDRIQFLSSSASGNFATGAISITMAALVGVLFG